MFTFKTTKRLAILTSFFAVATASTALADEMSDWMFDHLDANADGFIAKGEFRGSYLDGEGMDWTQGLRPACTEAVLKAMDPELTKFFEEIDASKDGKIDKAEFAKQGNVVYSAYWDKTFELADKNKNGKIDQKEFVAQLNDHYENLRKEYADDKLPADCKVDVSELKLSDEELASAESYFKSLDLNADAQLSKEEYMGKE